MIPPTVVKEVIPIFFTPTPLFRFAIAFVFRWNSRRRFRISGAANSAANEARKLRRVVMRSSISVDARPGQSFRGLLFRQKLQRDRQPFQGFCRKSLRCCDVGILFFQHRDPRFKAGRSDLHICPHGQQRAEHPHGRQDVTQVDRGVKPWGVSGAAEIRISVHRDIVSSGNNDKPAQPAFHIPHDAHRPST